MKLGVYEVGPSYGTSWTGLLGPPQIELAAPVTCEDLLAMSATSAHCVFVGKEVYEEAGCHWAAVWGPRVWPGLGQGLPQVVRFPDRLALL